MLRKIELSSADQRILEQRCLVNIRDCNERIRKNTATYNDWGNAPERLQRGYSREEFKSFFIDHWRAARRAWVLKLRDVRSGYVYE